MQESLSLDESNRKESAQAATLGSESMALPNSDCEGKLLASILTEERTTPELWRSSGHFVFLKRLVEFEALGLLHLTFRLFLFVSGLKFPK